MVDSDAQDSLRPFRTFVGALAGGLAAYSNDQTYAGADYYAYNRPYGYQSIGPWGAAVEGLPISTTRAGGVVISPVVVLLGVGAAIALMMRR